MSCANFQELLAGQGAATATDFTPANIDFPYDSDDELRLDIYNYQNQQWVNVPLATGATIDVGGAGDVFYAWETYLTDGQTGVRTILATAGTTPALPAGGTASHPLAPANNNYPVEGGTGVNVRLYRQTSIDAGELPAYFYPGASIRAQDLNDNFEALRKVVEESNCATNNINDGAAQLDARYWNKIPDDRDGDTITSDDTWVSDNNHVATTAAINARINTNGGAGGFVPHLIWSGTGNTREALQFQDTADGDPRNIADTEIVTVNGADVLRITFAAGVFTVTAVGPANLRWDQKCDQFTVTVQNPTGETNFIDEIISPLTTATNFETDLNEYTTLGVSPDFAAGVTSEQTFSVAEDDNLIVPGTTAADGLEGGEATATVTFRLVDDTVSTNTAVCNIEWPDAGTTLSTGTPISMTGNTFLQRYENCQIVVATRNLATPGNASHTLTSSDADDTFQTGTGGALTQPFTGNATQRVVWDEPIEWDTATIPTITCTTDYTRPAAVDGTGYTVDDQTVTLTPTANFTFPSLAQFRNSRNAGDAPTQASLIDGTGFEDDVTVLGNSAVTFDQTVNNDTGGITGFWFCCRANLANQPNRARILLEGQTVPTETEMVTVEDVALQDDDGNVTAVNYNCYGITLQQGFNNRVVFDRN